MERAAPVGSRWHLLASGQGLTQHIPQVPKMRHGAVVRDSERWQGFDEELELVVRAWPSLPNPIKAAVLAMLDAVCQ